MFDIRTLVAAAALSGAVLGWPAGVALNGLDQGNRDRWVDRQRDRRGGDDADGRNQRDRCRLTEAHHGERPTAVLAAVGALLAAAMTTTGHPAATPLAQSSEAFVDRPGRRR
jgi:hypothetical protein